MVTKLQSGVLVPRKKEAIDVVYLWLNGSDTSLRFSAHATGAEYKAHADNGLLLHSIRSLVKYGTDLNIGTIYIVTSGGQKGPSWLSNANPPEIANIRVIKDGDFGLPPVFSFDLLMDRVAQVPNLRENFVVWPEELILGKAAHRQDFWRETGGFGARFFLQNHVNRHKKGNQVLNALLGESKVERFALVPFPVVMAKSVLQIMCNQMKNRIDSDALLFVYVYWIIGHGLAGSVGGPDDLYFVNLNMPTQQIFRESHRHTFVHMETPRKVLPPLRELLEQRWPFKSPYEKM
jgi:hypothetical protein